MGTGRNPILKKRHDDKIRARFNELNSKKNNLGSKFYTYETVLSMLHEEFDLAISTIERILYPPLADRIKARLVELSNMKDKKKNPVHTKAGVANILQEEFKMTLNELKDTLNNRKKKDTAALAKKQVAKNQISIFDLSPNETPEN